MQSIKRQFGSQPVIDPIVIKHLGNPTQHKAAPSQSLKHVTWVPFLINSGTEALKYAQTTESTAVAFGWKNVDHATNRHLTGN